MASFTPGAYGVRTQWNYVSTLGVISGIANSVHKPEIGEMLVKRYGSQLITGLLDMAGAKAPVSSLQYAHYEEDRIMPKVKATNGGAGAAGGTVVFTVDSSSDLTFGQSAPYGGSGANYETGAIPVRLNDLVLIKPGAGTVSASTYIRGIVVAVSVSATPGASTFSVAPLDSADTIPSIPSADEIIITGNAFGEGSSKPEGRSSAVLSYNNNLQIMREAFDITGSEKDAVLWFKVKDASTGKEGWVWSLKGESDCYVRALNYRESNMIISEKITNYANAGITAISGTSGTPIKTTEGMIPAILGGGNITNYSGVTGWTLADGEAWVVEADKQKAAKENFVWAGINLSLAIDKELRNNFQNGAITFGGYSFDKDASVNLQFDSFKLGNYTFHKKTYDLFNDVQLFGADGYNFKNEAIVIPADTARDAKTGEKVPSLRMRYLQGPDGSNSRDMRHVVRDMFAITGSDKFECEYISESGLEMFGVNRYGYWKQA
jgi:hypothetical protein